MILTTNPYEQYKQQGVMTASPADLIVMLYDGCIRQLRVAMLSMEDSNAEISNNAMLKAQLIIQELSSSLDRKYEMSGDLAKLYDFMDEAIYNVVSSRNAKDLEPIVEMLQEMHEAWQDVAKQTRAGNLSIEGVD